MCKKVFTVKAMPNPFSTYTTISFNLSRSTSVSLKILDVCGREVKVLINGKHNPGKHQMVWSGEDDRGRIVRPGVYFYQLKTGEVHKVGKLVMLK